MSLNIASHTTFLLFKNKDYILDPLPRKTDMYCEFTERYATILLSLKAGKRGKHVNILHQKSAQKYKSKHDN